MAATSFQLTIDGDEEPLGRQPRPLGPLVEQLLEELEQHPGGLRAVEIGRILHTLRGGCPQEGKRWANWQGTRALGCCPYAASDGANLMLRLQGRGLVARGNHCWLRIY